MSRRLAAWLTDWRPMRRYSGTRSCRTTCSRCLKCEKRSPVSSERIVRRRATHRRSLGVSCCRTEGSQLMNNKRHAPSLEPDTGEPVPDPASSEISGGPAASAPSQGSVSELDVWKDRHLRLAAEYDNFRKRTTKERA